MAKAINHKILKRIKKEVEYLAEWDYPLVWIGEEGMTPEEILQLQEDNESIRRSSWENMGDDYRFEMWNEIPESEKQGIDEPPKRWDDLPANIREGLKSPLEVEPGEFVELEDTGKGVQMPRGSFEYLDGLSVVENLPHLVSENDLVYLQRDTYSIGAAKKGGVLVKTASKLKVVPESNLTEEDRIFITSAHLVDGGGALAFVFDGCLKRFVSLDDLSAEDVDGELLEELESYLENGIETYIIDDTDQSRRALTERLEEKPEKPRVPDFESTDRWKYQKRTFEDLLRLKDKRDDMKARTEEKKIEKAFDYRDAAMAVFAEKVCGFKVHYLDGEDGSRIATDRFSGPANSWRRAMYRLSGILGYRFFLFGEMRPDAWEEVCREALIYREQSALTDEELFGNWLIEREDLDPTPERIVREVEQIVFHGEELEERYRRVVEDTEKRIRELWPQIEAVAERLNEAGRLDGDEVRRIIEAA